LSVVLNDDPRVQRAGIATAEARRSLLLARRAVAESTPADPEAAVLARLSGRDRTRADPCNGFAGDVDDLSSGVEPEVRPGSLAS